MTHNAALSAQSGELLGHPKGLFVCFMTEMWERFAFYGMKTLLLLYLTKYHLFADADGYLLLGTYAGLAYALPLLGGLLADRYLGMRKAVIFGGLLLVLGQLGMAYTGDAATGIQGQGVRDEFALQVMYASLALIGVGVGAVRTAHWGEHVNFEERIVTWRPGRTWHSSARIDSRSAGEAFA